MGKLNYIRPIKKPGYSVEHDSWFIPLTQGVIALVDAYQVPILGQYNWNAYRDNRQYIARRTLSPRPLRGVELMTRSIMRPKRDELVDHITHFPMEERLIDNRRSNLRLCVKIENSRNRRPTSGTSSRFKGVSWRKRDQVWQAEIRAGKRRKYLGSFDDEVDAAKAYDAAAPEFHGKFARTNASMGLLTAHEQMKGEAG